MYNPLKVSLENIIPLTEARDHFSQIVTEVQKDKLYVLTKGGKPAVAIIDVKYLEHITGGEVKEEHVVEEIKKDPEKVGLAPMIEHKEDTSDKIQETSEPKVPESPKPITPPPISEPGPKPAPVPPPPPPMPEPEPKPEPPKPLETPPVPNETINVQIAPDETEIDKSADKSPNNIDEQTSPDDKAGPAQYSGSQDTNQKNEPDDMVID